MVDRSVLNDPWASAGCPKPQEAMWGQDLLDRDTISTAYDVEVRQV